MGGRAATRFETAVDPIAKALAELESIFQTALEKRLVGGRFVAWGTDPWSRTGYSFVPLRDPGGNVLIICFKLIICLFCSLQFGV